MKYEFVAKTDAPPPSLDRKKRRIGGLDEVIGELPPGQVARVEMDEGERPRQMVEQLYQAAVRQGKLLEVWEVGGVFYAAIAEDGSQG